MTEIQIAGGTVIGREHVTIGRNNQDAFCWASTPEATVGVVADGCGSGVHSEVGAQIGARLLTEALRVSAAGLDCEAPKSALERLRLDLLVQVRQVAEAMGGSFNQVVGEYFLFTLLGFVIGPRWTTIFGIGDGVFVLNGQRRVLVAADNAPPYAGYGLLGPDGGGPRFEVHAALATQDLRSLLVGTDGAGEIPDLAELWTDDRYYANPYNVGRRLVQWNRTHRPGLLPDDTTLVVARHGRR
jgi:hypothetical protein